MSKQIEKIQKEFILLKKTTMKNLIFTLIMIGLFIGAIYTVTVERTKCKQKGGEIIRTTFSSACVKIEKL